MPFELTVPEGRRDPKVKLTLRDPQKSGAAILAWAVEGCRRWQAEGLSEPNAVRQSTTEYREEVDLLAPFFRDRAEDAPGEEIEAGDLYRAYVMWASWTGLRYTKTQNAFGRLMKNRLERERRGGKTFYKGLRLRSSGVLST